MSQETAGLDDRDKDRTFECFPRLPRELGFMVWEESLPERYVNPRSRGPLAILSPPAAAHVCHDSRIIALQYGAPYGLYDEHKKGNSVWFMPRKDIIVLGNRPASFVHRVCGTSAWDVVQKLAVRIPHNTYRGGWMYVKHIVRLPQLKEIFFMPIAITIDTRPTNTTKWPPHVKSGIFRNNTYRLVDLDDSSEFHAAVCLLHSHRNTTQEAYTLCRARSHSNEIVGDENVKLRLRAIAVFERAWLEERGVPVVILSDGLTLLKTKAVKLALKRMPTIRLVRGYFDCTADMISSEDRLVCRYDKKTRQAHQPKYVFNYESRLWQDFVAEQACG